MPYKTPKNFPPVHSRFKKGQSGNPGGVPKRYCTIDQLRLIIDELFKMSRKQMEAKINHPKSTMLEIQLAATLARAAKDGDYSRMNFLIERLIGKVPDDLNQRISAAEGTAIITGPQVIVTLPSNGREEIVAESKPDP